MTLRKILYAQYSISRIIFYPTISDALKCTSTAKTNTPQARVGFYPLPNNYVIKYVFLFFIINQNKINKYNATFIHER